MRLPLHIAVKLQQMLTDGCVVNASDMKHEIVERMVADAVLGRLQTTKRKAVIGLNNATALPAYLLNHFGINNLQAYILKYADENITRSEAIEISGNSKLKTIRTFKGFLVNSYQPIKTKLYNKELLIQPSEGSYTYIHDYETFVPDVSVTIVGIENPENFRYIQRQQYLFPHIAPLFVCRYPQSNDLIHWLSNIPNPYLHFGDLDFEGIYIYLSEYKKYLGEKSACFVPPNTAELISKYGNRSLYDKQFNIHTTVSLTVEQPIEILLQLLHRYKKVLEQEIFLKYAGHSLENIVKL